MEERERGLVTLELPPIPEELSGGQYANYVMVGVSELDFHLDFWRIEPLQGGETPKARMAFVQRMWISPHLVKGLIDALQETVDKFEEGWGVQLTNMRELKKQRGQ